LNDYAILEYRVCRKRRLDRGLILTKWFSGTRS
jgi:hypothetical protein